MPLSQPHLNGHTEIRPTCTCMCVCVCVCVCVYVCFVLALAHIQPPPTLPSWPETIRDPPQCSSLCISMWATFGSCTGRAHTHLPTVKTTHNPQRLASDLYMSNCLIYGLPIYYSERRRKPADNCKLGGGKEKNLTSQFGHRTDMMLDISWVSGHSNIVIKLEWYSFQLLNAPLQLGDFILA